MKFSFGDLIYLVLLLAFILPELLKKRKRPEDYEYPEIPESPQQTQEEPPAGRDIRLPPGRDIKPPSGPRQVPIPDLSSRPGTGPTDAPANMPPTVPPALPQPLPQPKRGPMPVATEGEAPLDEPNFAHQPGQAAALTAVSQGYEFAGWDGKLDQATVVNGLIFAEILQPPRSRRPLAPIWRTGRRD